MDFIGITLRLFFSFLQVCLIFADEKPCGQHNVKVEEFKNCPQQKTQNVVLHNLTFTLTDDCKLIPRGCFKVKKPIAGAKIEYYVNKTPLLKKGTEDFCKQLENPDAQKRLQNYKNLPHKCTVAAGDYCITKGSTTIEQLNPKILNLVQGTTNGYVKLEGEGSTDKSCINFKIVVSRK